MDALTALIGLDHPSIRVRYRDYLEGTLAEVDVCTIDGMVPLISSCEHFYYVVQLGKKLHHGLDTVAAIHGQVRGRVQRGKAKFIVVTPDTHVRDRLNQGGIPCCVWEDFDYIPFFKRITCQEAINQYYSRLAGPEYESKMQKWEVPGARQEVFTRLELAKGQQVLEVGCGTGLNFPYYSPSACHVGLDINHDMLSAASRRIHDGGLAYVTLAQANAHHMPFDDHQFDRCTLTYALAGIPDNWRVLPEVCRVVKPQGLISILDFRFTLSETQGGCVKHDIKWLVRQSGLPVLASVTYSKEACLPICQYLLLNSV